MTRTIHSEGQEALIRSLTEARKAAGLTQAELAARLRCHQSFVARVESGQRRIDVAELIILSRALGSDPHQFLETVNSAIPEDARI